MSAPLIDPPRGPRSVERPANAGVSLLGVYGQAPIAAVDQAGALQPTGADWCLDWWIMGEDRWYTPASEAAVRQQRIGAGPIIQTSLRISGGDVVHRVWATQQAGGPALVVEVENTTKVPVALALAVRRFDLAGQKSSPRVALSADHIEILQADQPPRTIWLSSEARDQLPDHDAVVIPLPHKAMTRILLLSGPGTVDREIPALATATAAWDSLLTTNTRVSLPDDRITALFDQGRGRLALETHALVDQIGNLAEGAGGVLTALSFGGFETEAVEAVRALLDEDWLPRTTRKYDPGTLAAVADGLSWASVLHAPYLADPLLRAMTQLAQLVARKKSAGPTHRAERALARLAHVAGQVDAAAAIDPAFGLDSDPSIPGSVAEIQTLLQTASEAGSWGIDAIEPVVESILGLRQILVRERWDAGQPELELFTEWPAAWRGGGAELHAIPTAFGRISVAIRWHGYRPALLWQFDRADHIARPVRLRCSSLDPDWTTTDSSGEALLAGSAEGLAAAPVEGESFS